MSLLGKSWKLKIPIGLGVLALLVTIGLTGQSDPQEKPEPKGVLKPGQTLTLGSDKDVPYVGPQNSISSGKQEQSDETHLIPPSAPSDLPPVNSGNFAGQTGLAWGKDILSSFDRSYLMDGAFSVYKAALTSHPNGRLYVAYELTSSWATPTRFIYIDYSDDGGLTWHNAGWAHSSVNNFANPTIAVTATHIIVAYEVRVAGDNPYVEVATAPLLSSGIQFTARSVDHFTVDYEIKPHLWSDIHTYSNSSSAYLVCEQVYDVGTNNYNILFQRTGDNGATWKDFNDIFGSTVTDRFQDPHGCWGEGNGHYLYVTAYDETTKTIKLMRSTDWGVSFTAEQNLQTLVQDPAAGPVAPVIAAAVTGGNQHVQLYFNGRDVAGADDDIYYMNSSNHGATWNGGSSTTWMVFGQTTGNEEGVWAVADPLGRFMNIAWSVGGSVFYQKCDQNLVSWKNNPLLQVNRGGTASGSYPYKGIATDWKFGFPGFVWLDYDYHPTNRYMPFFNRQVPDDLVGTWDGQGVYFRTDGNKWVRLASPALQVAAGDLDGAYDGTADLVGVWTGQGLNALKSTTGTWAYLGTAPNDIAVGNMDGGASKEVVGTWTGTGVFYLTILGGTWTNMATPATMITAGDLDGDGIDDLIGVWPAQAGVWVKYSQTATWAYIGSAPRHIATGDMDGDGRSDLLGTWDGQGVYWRKSQTGAWTYLGSPATLITSADMDGDGKDDVVGIWPSQAGVWTKYSSNNQWEYIGSAVRDFSSGKMRGGSHTWGAANVEAVETLDQSGLPIPTQDFSANSPGAPGFKPLSQPNLVPVQDPLIQIIPGPGMPGFTCTMTPNPIPVLPRDRKIGSEVIQR